jgi:MarR family 2-MHQ and catechol resistance regulon transcriptional repressor
LLRTAEDLWNASRVFFDRWDLSPSQFNVLNVLYGSPDGLSQSELSRLLIMHRSNATGLIDRLEKRGLVRRETNPVDRRAYRVVITPKGAELLNNVYPHYFSAAEQVWAHLPDTAVTQLIEQLQGLAAQASAVASADSGVRESVTPPASATADPGSPLPERPPTPHQTTQPHPTPPASAPAPAPEPVPDSAATISESADPLRTSDL